jgi:hypothetical protein
MHRSFCGAQWTTMTGIVGIFASELGSKLKAALIG